MDIGAISIGVHQASLQDEVSVSVLKMAMNSGNEVAYQMADMISNMAVDTSKGKSIDAMA